MQTLILIAIGGLLVAFVFWVGALSSDGSYYFCLLFWINSHG